MTVAPLPDATPENWVDRLAPEALKPWLKLGRFDRPVGIWLLMLPGWAGIALNAAERGELPDPLLLALFAAGAVLMRAAGCAYNDIVDRDLDRRVARTAQRPIASGRLSRKQGWAFVVACSLLGLAILMALPITAVWLGVWSLALVASYPFMKRITWWPQAWLGLTFNWGALMGYASAEGGGVTIGWFYLTGNTAGETFLQTFETPAALLLFAGLAVWTVAYDTVYAVQDLEDDALAGVKSSARRLGARAPRAVARLYVLAAVLVAAAFLTAGLGPLAWAGLVAFAAHLAWQARKLRLDDPQAALTLFKSNRDAGLILVLATVAGAWRP